VRGPGGSGSSGVPAAGWYCPVSLRQDPHQGHRPPSSRRARKNFDSSWSHNTPLTTVIGEGQVIKGWDTAWSARPSAAAFSLSSRRPAATVPLAPPRRALAAPTPSCSSSTSSPPS